MIRPGPISSRTGTFEVSRPARTAVTSVPTERNISRTPVPSAE